MSTNESQLKEPSRATQIVIQQSEDYSNEKFENSPSPDTISHKQTLNQDFRQSQGIDMTLINDINNECNYLITKFQQNQTPGAQRPTQIHQPKTFQPKDELSNQDYKSSRTEQVGKNPIPKARHNETQKIHEQQIVRVSGTGRGSNPTSGLSDWDDGARTENRAMNPWLKDQERTLKCNDTSSQVTAQAEHIGGINQERFPIKDGFLGKKSSKQLQMFTPQNVQSNRPMKFEDQEGEFDGQQAVHLNVRKSENKITFRQEQKEDSPIMDNYEGISSEIQNKAQFELHNFKALNAQMEKSSLNSFNQTANQARNSVSNYQLPVDSVDASVEFQKPKHLESQSPLQPSQQELDQLNNVDISQLDLEKEVRIDSHQHQLKPESNQPDPKDKFIKPSPDQDSPKQPLELNDQTIFNRLPKNFFVQEPDHKDLSSVMANIREKREGFLDNLGESRLQEKIDEIAHILSPEQFFRKHFQGEDPETLMFQEQLPQMEQKNMWQESERLASPIDNYGVKSSEDLVEEVKQNIDTIERQIEKSSRRERINSNQEKVISDIRSGSNSIDDINVKVGLKEEQQFDPYGSNRMTSMNNSQPLSVLQSTKKQKIPQSNNFAPRLGKMADYFNKDVSSQIIDDTDQLSPQQKLDLAQKLEQDLLNKIDINFLFSRGESLKHNLIDMDRLFKIINKIKDVAAKSAERGERQIDYQEIVDYIQEQDIKDQKDFERGDDIWIPQSNVEPDQTQFQLSPGQKQDRWKEIVEFMRKNPKLMMQMLPDNSDDEKEDKLKGKLNKIQQNIEEAKRWEKLQALSKKFLDHKSQNNIGNQSSGKKVISKSFDKTTKKAYKRPPFRFNEPLHPIKERVSKKERGKSDNQDSNVLSNRNIRDSYHTNPNYQSNAESLAQSNLGFNQYANRPLQSQQQVRRVVNKHEKSSKTTASNAEQTTTALRQNNRISNQFGYKLDQNSNEELNKNFQQRRPITANVTHNQFKGLSGFESKSSYNHEVQKGIGITNQSMGTSFYDNFHPFPSKPSQPSNYTFYEGMNQSDYDDVASSQKPYQGLGQRTKKFIEKMAPNLKESETHNKFMSNINSKQYQARDSAPSQSIVSNQTKRGQSQKKNGSFVENKRNEIKRLNHSSANASDALRNQKPENQQQQQIQYSMNFPKFIKRQLSNRSDGSKGFDPESNPIKKGVNMNVQTSIKGLDNKLYIRHKEGTDNHSVIEEAQSAKSSHPYPESLQSNKFVKSHVKVPIIDWSTTLLFSKVSCNDTEFNKSQSDTLYMESEVDYVIDMMRGKYKEFKRSDLMRPFYLKALATLKELLQEQNLSQIFERQSKNYKEITIENTMKLLIRCKLNFSSRNLLLSILRLISEYERNATELRNIIDKQQNFIIEQEDYDQINGVSEKVFSLGQNIVGQIQGLREAHKQFKQPFIFKQKDYVNYVKTEMNEVKKLLAVFRIKEENDEIELQQDNVVKEDQLSDYDEEDEII